MRKFVMDAIASMTNLRIRCQIYAFVVKFTHSLSNLRIRCQIYVDSLSSLLCNPPLCILCIRGSRSSRHRPVHELNIALATSEGCVPSDVQ